VSNKYFQTVGNMLLARLNNAQKGKPLPPPAAPPPQDNVRFRPMELYVPYRVAEFPRTFLHMLAKSNDVPPEVRALITEWLNEYDQKLNKYMHDRYGDGVSALTNTITRRVMEDQNNAAQREVNRLTDNTIEALEKQFEQDNGDESDNA
jgi:hypothetical protein